jgi:hypothetical protein
MEWRLDVELDPPVAAPGGEIMDGADTGGEGS